MDDMTRDSLLGSWKLTSARYRMSDNGEVIDEHIQGFCTFDANGRWTAVAVPSDLDAPESDAERSAIFSRTIAFSGRCSFDGNQITVKLDVAWNPAFKGREFQRIAELEGDRLTIIQPEWEHPFFKGRKTVGTVTWQ